MSSTQYTADYAMAYSIMKFIGYSTATFSFLLKLSKRFPVRGTIGWAYIRVINNPLQELVAKKGGGCILGGIF